MRKKLNLQNGGRSIWLWWTAEISIPWRGRAVSYPVFWRMHSSSNWKHLGCFLTRYLFFLAIYYTSILKITAISNLPIADNKNNILGTEEVYVEQDIRRWLWSYWYPNKKYNGRRSASVLSSILHPSMAHQLSLDNPQTGDEEIGLYRPCSAATCFQATLPPTLEVDYFSCWCWHQS